MHNVKIDLNYNEYIIRLIGLRQKGGSTMLFYLIEKLCPDVTLKDKEANQSSFVLLAKISVKLLQKVAFLKRRVLHYR